MSKALQPCRRVASKNGVFRYQGPKYRVVSLGRATIPESSFKAPRVATSPGRRARAPGSGAGLQDHVGHDQEQDGEVDPADHEQAADQRLSPLALGPLGPQGLHDSLGLRAEEPRPTD